MSLRESKDITNEVEFDDNDGGLLPLVKCACGKEFESWTFCLETDEDEPRECPNCKRKMYFRIKITVYEKGAP